MVTCLILPHAHGPDVTDSAISSTVELLQCPADAEVPHSSSEFNEWGEIDARALHPEMERWLITVLEHGVRITVGDMTAIPTWYGASSGSMAMSIGIDVVADYRGRGVGTEAQRRLAALLHSRGIVRVQASTDVTNIPEQRALAKAGFTFEGIMRGAQVRASGRHDLQVWSHLDSDGWNKR